MQVIYDYTMAPLQQAVNILQEEAESLDFSEWLSFAIERHRVALTCVSGIGTIIAFLFSVSKGPLVCLAFVAAALLASVFAELLILTIVFIKVWHEVLAVADCVESPTKFIKQFYRVCLLDKVFVEDICHFNLEQLESTVGYFRSVLDIEDGNVSDVAIVNNGKTISFTLIHESHERHFAVQVANAQQIFTICEPQVVLSDNGCEMYLPSNGRV